MQIAPDIPETRSSGGNANSSEFKLHPLAVTREPTETALFGQHAVDECCTAEAADTF